MKKYIKIVHVRAEERGYGEHKRTLPALTVTVEVELDLDAIATNLGRKAARSKGQKATDLGGLVVARILKDAQ